MHLKMKEKTLFTILYIDDNRSMTKLFSFLSQEYNFRALVANVMEEGINIALQEQPDLIITDIYMPDGDGYKLTAKLKSDRRTYAIPVIGCSITYAEKGKRLFLLGGDKFVNDKPYNIDKLNAILEGIAPKLKIKE